MRLLWKYLILLNNLSFFESTLISLEAATLIIVIILDHIESNPFNLEILNHFQNTLVNIFLSYS